MEDGTTDTMRVKFPADPDYGRIGRVAVAGLALRLGIDVQRVENLRLAVDASVAALQGPGEISVNVSWAPGELTLDITNGEAVINTESATELGSRLDELVPAHTIAERGVQLRMADEPSAKS